MNTPDPIPPTPKDFGVRRALWAIWWTVWSNAISIMQTGQLILIYLQGNEEGLMSKADFHKVIAANAILSIILAQIKRAKPAPAAQPS